MPYRGNGHFLTYYRIASILAVFATLAALPAVAATADESLVQESRQAMEAADPYMGDWQGKFYQRNRRSTESLVAQVIALGAGRYHATILPEFDKRTTAIAQLEGELKDGALQFYGWGDISAYRGPDWQGQISQGQFTGMVSSREGGNFTLEKVVRISPTLGAKPPQNAIVLFDGKNLDQWIVRDKKAGARPPQWKLINGAAEVARTGVLGQTIQTKERFGDFKMHLEFRTPFMPDKREQARGNSGVYCHGLETQVLDSYGLGGREKECGGIYGRRAPLVNMCAPPLQWQTYDFTIATPQTGNSRITVVHNGVTVQDGVDMGKRVSEDIITLQDHGNPVQYRNIWLVKM